MNYCILFDRLRWEEKEILNSFIKKGYSAKLVDIKKLVIPLNENSFEIPDVILERCLGHYRSLFSAKIFEQMGKKVINKSEVIETCMNKLYVTLALVRNKVRTPRTFVSFSSESCMQVEGALGLPVVIKPITGSWGRLISLARDRQSLESILELRDALQNPLHHVYYMQEFVRRPPRDIRAVVVGDEIVACVYRYSTNGEWKTNVARGAKSVRVDVSKELEDTIYRASDSVGKGILGIDIMESEHGYLVHEVNSNVEFKGAQSASEKNISDAIVDYVVRESRR